VTEDLGEIVVDARFCGPKNSGNGGYSAGLVAAFVDGPARVSLKSPPPIDTPMRVSRDGAQITVRHGETLVATAKPARLDIEVPEPPEPADVKAARAAYLEHEASHYLPYCFVCGPKREEGDGLRIFAGPAPESTLNADFWRPHDGLAGEDGLVRPEFLWAALDCPTAFAIRLPEGRVCLLGAIAVEVKRRPKPGERLEVLAWKVDQDGRKHMADSALVAPSGDAIAVAEALWIELVDPELIKTLRSENE